MTPGIARARLRLQTEQFASAGTSEMPPGIDLHFCLPYTLAFTALGTSGPRTSCPHFTAFHWLRPSIYCFRDFGSPDFVDFGSPDFVSAFTAFHGLWSSIYCFKDFGSPDFVSAFTAFQGLRPSIYCFRNFGSPDFVSAFTAFRTSRPFYCFLRALAPHLPLHIRQISIRLLSYGKRGELPQRATTGAVAGTKRGASHDLWLPPFIEHATKEGQAVSTPFWPTGFPHEDFQPRLGTLFITQQSEANRRARGHEQ
ncbi:hypothetical protein CDL15_Pgr023870 [Punica granatum]|uniref:Uncharacterized protein n=1 Tax=Punica granatum TaxID=22663 RepID=A0A218XHU6_PUNGR|nr:hypothetical protein CDL15_Pgr023870 [Punica granatum]